MDVVKCKHCGIHGVGKKVILIMRYDLTILGDATEHDVKDLFDNMERKARGEEITSESIIDMIIEDGLYCFDCDKYQ